MPTKNELTFLLRNCKLQCKLQRDAMVEEQRAQHRRHWYEIGKLREELQRALADYARAEMDLAAARDQLRRQHRPRVKVPNRSTAIDPRGVYTAPQVDTPDTALGASPAEYKILWRAGSGHDY